MISGLLLGLATSLAPATQPATADEEAGAIAPGTAIAPVPLFADPNFHGSCDPEVVWNEATGQWLIYYTARRALAPDGNTPAATPIGLAVSDDWRTWDFAGYCQFDGGDDAPTADNTYWAPGVVVAGDAVHMFVSFGAGTDGFWGGQPKRLRRYAADPAEPLAFTSKDYPIQGETAIDAGLLHVDGEWRMYYRRRPEGSPRGVTTCWATSADLVDWQPQGPAAGEVNDMAVNGHGYQEAQYAFRWRGHYWLLTDPSGPALAAYRSDDADTWTFAGDIMGEPGSDPTDKGHARHPSVAVVDDRLFIFYHCEPDRTDGPYEQVPIEKRRTYLQVAEAHLVDGKLVIDRDAPVRLPSAETLREGNESTESGEQD